MSTIAPPEKRPFGALPWVAPTDDAVASLTDDALLAAVCRLEQLTREIDIAQARYSSEIARRSRRELGNSGLAARHGHLTAAGLLKSVTRGTMQEAFRRIRVGEMLTDAAAAEDAGGDAPLGGIASAVLDGRLGLAGADQVIRALSPVVDHVDPQQLREATAVLALESASRDADDIGAMARGVRDTLDRVGVIDRERHLRAQRSLRRGPVIDGLRRVSLTLDPESDAIIMGAIDHAMSPRLGGPRFTRPRGGATRGHDDRRPAFERAARPRHPRRPRSHRRRP